MAIHFPSRDQLVGPAGPLSSEYSSRSAPVPSASFSNMPRVPVFVSPV